MATFPNPYGGTARGLQNIQAAISGLAEQYQERKRGERASQLQLKQLELDKARMEAEQEIGLIEAERQKRMDEMNAYNEWMDRLEGAQTEAARREDALRGFGLQERQVGLQERQFEAQKPSFNLQASMDTVVTDALFENIRKEVSAGNIFLPLEVIDSAQEMSRAGIPFTIGDLADIQKFSSLDVLDQDITGATKQNRVFQNEINDSFQGQPPNPDIMAIRENRVESTRGLFDIELTTVDWINYDTFKEQYQSTLEDGDMTEADVEELYLRQAPTKTVKLSDTEAIDEIMREQESPLHNYDFHYKSVIKPKGGQKVPEMPEPSGQQVTEDVNRKTALDNLLKAYPKLEELSPEVMGVFFRRYMSGEEKIDDLLREYGIVANTTQLDKNSINYRSVVPAFIGALPKP